MADGAEFLAQLRLEIENERDLLKILKGIAEKSGDAIEDSLRDGLKKADKDALKLQRSLNLRNVNKQTEELKLTTAQIAANGARLASRLRQAGASDNISILDVGRVRKAEQGLRRMNDTLGQTREKMQQTSLHSQNVLRVIQDAPFGIFGMANNIQELGTSVSRLRAEGKSLSQIFSILFKPLIFGPMAIGLVLTLVTVLAQSWDKLGGALDKVKGLLGLVTDEQRSLNDAIREFNKLETFEEFVQGLGFEEIEVASKAAREELNLARKELQELGIGDPDATANRIRFANFVNELAALGKGGATVQEQTEREQALERFARAKERLNVITAEKRQKLFDENFQRQLGMQTDRDKEAEEKEKERLKRLEELAQAELELNKELAEEAEEFREDLQEENLKEREASEKEFQSNKLDQIKTAIALEKKMRRRQLQEEAAMIRKILGDARFRAATIRADAPGTEAPEQATAQQQIQALRQRQRAKFDAGMTELIATQQAARVTNDKQMRDKLLQNAELMKQRLIKIQTDTDKQITAIQRKEFNRRLSMAEGMANSLGESFGNLATIMASESEKGLEKNKGFLKAAAMANAIAASVAAFRAVMDAPSIGPGVIIQAGLTMSAVFTGLKAQIKKIDSAGENTSLGKVSGSFTALNSSITGKRAENFAQQQNRLAQAADASRNASTEEAVRELGEKIQDQKVILDEPTAARATRAGDRRNTRRVQTSN